MARNIRVEVEEQAGGKRVGLTGEVPNEEIRQAVMKEVEARVEHGDKRGRTIGFPTANMKLVDCLKPAFGIYAVRARIIEDDRMMISVIGK